MSSLWKVIVLKKNKTWLDLKVTLDHPDAGDFPEDYNFALQLLTAKAYGFDKDYNYKPTSPLGKKIKQESSFLPSKLEPIVDKFVKNAVIYKASNLPWTEAKAHARVDKQLRAIGLSKSDDNWENAWTDKWREYWLNEKKLPSAIYRITVTDPKWIEHLETGMSYTTASFSESGPWVSENRDLEIEMFTDEPF